MGPGSVPSVSRWFISVWLDSAALCGFLSDLVAQLLRLGGVDLLVELVVDQDHGRGAEAREALDELDRDLAIGRDLAGVLIAMVYNFAARWTGGIEVVLEEKP